MFFQNEFFVTVLSNDSLNVFPDNVKCAFTNIVNIPETMSDEWEVGITDIYLNNCFGKNHKKLRRDTKENTSEESSSNSSEFISLVNSETFRYKAAPLKADEIEYGPIFIYTDIIKPRCVGSKRPRCLRVLFTNGREKFMQFRNVEYYPIENYSPNEISILITDSSGYKIPFETSSIPIFLTLHFRKRRKIL